MVKLTGEAHSEAPGEVTGEMHRRNPQVMPTDGTPSSAAAGQS